MTIKIHQVRACQLCAAWFDAHPSFPVSAREEAYRYPLGPWRHRTALGQRIHRLVSTTKTEEGMP